MNSLYIADRTIKYDGLQLAPHWIYRNFDILGDCVVAFTGECQVALNEMVDIEDVKANAPIYSPWMLHVIAEFFGVDLHATVYRQRLLIVTAKELLESMVERKVVRDGDDLFLARPDGAQGKLSVSIATASNSSTLVHTGFNIETEGTPVPTVGLKELGIDPAEFGQQLLQRYTAEMEDIWFARCKVRTV